MALVFVPNLKQIIPFGGIGKFEDCAFAGSGDTPEEFRAQDV
jgi:hypothetical protein